MSRAVSFFKVHLFFYFPSITGADGEQQPELCQACVDLRNQRPTEDAALSAVHSRPLNCRHASTSVPDQDAVGEAIETIFLSF